MPTNDPITTDRLIAGIREGIAEQPALAVKARPVADRFTTLIHYRLPKITAADGDLMIHIAAFLADVMTALTAEGDAPVDAITTATSAIALAGLELHDSGETHVADDDAETADAAARLRAWFKAEGPLVMDEEDLDDVQKVLAAYEHGVTAQPTAEQDADVRAVAKVLDLYGKAPYQGLHEMELIAAHLDLQNRFADRITDLAARNEQGNAPAPCVYYNQPCHVAEQKPHPDVYGDPKGPDAWPRCAACRERAEQGSEAP